MIELRQNRIFGELRLQSLHEENFFFAEDIKNDENVNHGSTLTGEPLRPYEYTHETKKEETSVIIDPNSTVIQAIYKDRYGDEHPDFRYEVSIIIWIEVDD